MITLNNTHVSNTQANFTLNQSTKNLSTVTSNDYRLTNSTSDHSSSTVTSRLIEVSTKNLPLNPTLISLTSSAQYPHNKEISVDSIRSDKLIVLDLDETLVYATKDPISGLEADFKVEDYHVYERPGLHSFVEDLSSHSDFAVWTSAGEDYAKAMCEHIFDQRHAQKPKFTWSASRCQKVFNHNTWETDSRKPLKKVKNSFHIALGKIIMIDDSPEKHVQNYGNLVRVSPFYGDRHDNELADLGRYLTHLLPLESVRTVEKRGWQDQI